MHGGQPKEELHVKNVKALKLGLSNLKKHMETLEEFKVPFVIAINRFITDSEEELNLLKEWCQQHRVEVSLVDVWANGGTGGIDLANKVLGEIQNNRKEFSPLYELSDSLQSKIESIAFKVYGASEVTFARKAKQQLVQFEEQGWGALPVCMAKTQYSLSDNPKSSRET